MRITWSKYGIPHGYVCSTPVHLIYRLKGCLPVGPLKELHTELKEQLMTLTELGDHGSEHRANVLEEFQIRYDELLDACDQRNYILSNTEEARIVLDSWRWLEEQKICQRLAICIMGNHVHALIVGFEGNDEIPLGDLMRQHKTFTSQAIQKKTGRKKVVWERGYFDRYVREGSLEEVILYILNNPVKAKLVPNWVHWRNTYIDPRLDVSTFAGSI